MKRRAFLALAGGLAVAPTAVLAAHKKAAPAKGGTSAKAGAAAKKHPAAAKGSAKSAPKANLRAPAASSSSHISSGIRTAPLPRPKFENWRRYELQIRVTPGESSAPLRAWIPVPMESDWQRLDDMEWQGNFSHAALKRDPESGLLSFVTDWQGARNGAPEASLTLRMSTRQRLFDITRRGLSLESEDSLSHSLQPFGPWPQDAIADLAERIIGRIREPMPQAMAIYEWLVDHAGPNCAPGNLVLLPDRPGGAPRRPRPHAAVGHGRAARGGGTTGARGRLRVARGAGQKQARCKGQEAAASGDHLSASDGGGSLRIPRFAGEDDHDHGPTWER